MNTDIMGPGREVKERILEQIKARGYEASNEIRNATLQVFRGTRSGRRYRVPHTLGKGKTPSGRKRKPRYYTASAPGEPPANRTRTLRMSWAPRPRMETRGSKQLVYPGVGTELGYAAILEKGYDANGRKMEPRPYQDRVKKLAMPKVRAIYRRPYV